MYISSFYFWMKVESLAKKCYFFLGIVVTGTHPNHTQCTLIQAVHLHVCHSFQSQFQILKQKH